MTVGGRVNEALPIVAEANKRIENYLTINYAEAPSGIELWDKICENTKRIKSVLNIDDEIWNSYSGQIKFCVDSVDKLSKIIADRVFGTRPGRPRIPWEHINFIRKISSDHPEYGEDRIALELELKFGIHHSSSTIRRYMVKRPTTSPVGSQSWKTFLANQAEAIWSCDFFTQYTITIRIFYVYLVIEIATRKVIYFNVTANPTADWTTQQITEAFPFDETPRYMIRDRDGIYGDLFRKRVKNMGIDEVPIAPRARWQNPYCERVIGSIRRECLDRVIILNEIHLKRILSSYLDYYHHSRTHLSLDRNSPVRRAVEERSQGEVLSIPQVGGLHHRYTRAA